MIGHNLCPFAHRVVKAGGLRLYRHVTTGVADAIERVVLEAVALTNGPAERTSIVVFEAGLESFDVFLDVVAGCEIVLEDMALSSTIQLAHFNLLQKVQTITIIEINLNVKWKFLRLIIIGLMQRIHSLII